MSPKTNPTSPLRARTPTCRPLAQCGQGEPWVRASAAASRRAAALSRSRFRTTGPMWRPAAAKKLDPSAQQKAVPRAASSPTKRIRRTGGALGLLARPAIGTHLGRRSVVAAAPQMRDRTPVAAHDEIRMPPGRGGVDLRQVAMGEIGVLVVHFVVVHVAPEPLQPRRGEDHPSADIGLPSLGAGGPGL